MADERARTLRKNATRDAWLRRESFAVMRIWNYDVVSRIDDVLTHILESAIMRIRSIDAEELSAPPSVSFADTSPASGGGKKEP